MNRSPAGETKKSQYGTKHFAMSSALRQPLYYFLFFTFSNLILTRTISIIKTDEKDVGTRTTK